VDASVVDGRLTQVKDNEVTLTDGESTSTYKTELAEFKNEQWVVDTLGQWIRCKVVDRQIVSVESQS